MKSFFIKGCIFIAALPLIAHAETAPSSLDKWQVPSPIYKQKFDWVKLTSGEWLKGDIISMYDEELEFDSDKLDSQTIDLDDVAELRSKEVQSIRLTNGLIVEGYLVILDDRISIVNNGASQDFPIKDLISIASSGQNEWDLWTGYANLGLNISSGNTEQFDYTITAGAQRRSSTSRFKLDYLANYSKTKNAGDDGIVVESVTADKQNITSLFDWFFSQKIFFRVAEAEYESNKLTNIDARIRYGVGLGYQVIDSSKMNWEVTAGPSYQTTKYINLIDTDDLRENSAGLSLGTSFDYEVTSDVDYDLSYKIQFVNEKSGKRLHTFQTGLDVDLAGDFDLDVTFFLDRIDQPTEGIEQNDYRFVVSLGYDF